MSLGLKTSPGPEGAAIGRKYNGECQICRFSGAESNWRQTQVFQATLFRSLGFEHKHFCSCSTKVGHSHEEAIKSGREESRLGHNRCIRRVEHLVASVCLVLVAIHFAHTGGGINSALCGIVKQIGRASCRERV